MLLIKNKIKTVQEIKLCTNSKKMILEIMNKIYDQGLSIMFEIQKYIQSWKVKQSRRCGCVQSKKRNKNIIPCESMPVKDKIKYNSTNRGYLPPPPPPKSDTNFHIYNYKNIGSPWPDHLVDDKQNKTYSGKYFIYKGKSTFIL